MKVDDVTEELYPIRTVSILTGINPVTLRAWERRYGLIEPRRTPSGHRLYSRKNIDTINRAIELQDQGMTIGRVAQVLRQHLAQERLRSETENWDERQAEMQNAGTAFSDSGLDLVFDTAIGRHGIQTVLRRLIVPLLDRLEDETESRDHAGQCFFDLYLRGRLAGLFRERRRLARGLRLLVTGTGVTNTESRQLIFALAAQEAGYRPVVVGNGLPPEELAATAELARCEAIVLHTARAAEVGFGRIAETGVPLMVVSAAGDGQAIRSNGAIPLGRNVDDILRRLTDCVGKPVSGRLS